MKNLTLAFLLAMLTLCGCAHQYVMKLNNGMQVTTATKPQLEGNSYHFKDAKGQEHVISMGRVTEITPASMARDEARPVSSPQAQKHWYWPF
jgi:hypothetical protein